MDLSGVIRAFDAATLLTSAAPAGSPSVAETFA